MDEAWQPIVFILLIAGLIGCVLWGAADTAKKTQEKALQDYAQCKTLAEEDDLPQSVAIARLQWCFEKFHPDLEAAK